MKKLLKLILIYTIFSILIYLIISFIELNFDFTEWERQDREALAVASSICTLYFFIWGNH